MNFPPPTDKQARVLWAALTALAVAVVVALLGVLLVGFGWVLERLSGVLLPLAVAGILACLLDPVVDFIERRRSIPRTRAIVLVFLLGVALALLLSATVVPRLIYETDFLAGQAPAYTAQLRTQLSEWLVQSPRGMKAKEIWDAHGGEAQQWLTERLPLISAWVLDRLGRAASWAGLFIGFLLTPIYVFYFLKEKSGIVRSWADYLPLHESKWKEELVFVLRSVNDSLIVFFRGQILVAMCVGVLMTLGFLVVGLDYAFLLGALAGALGIVPYLGTVVSFLPAVLLAFVQYGNWQRPVAVVGVFVVVHLAESWVISPRIIGNRVGLHPLTIIIAVLVGTTLLGGLLGGMLAIPLTAVLRTLMFRYVWKKRE